MRTKGTARAVKHVLAALLLTFVSGGCALVYAQSLNPSAPAGTPSSAVDEKLTVDANEIVYDADHKTVSATGNAKLYYQGKVLEADRVTYTESTRRVFAEGHVILTSPDKQVVHADKLELSEQFRDGFVNSLRIDTADSTHFAAPRAERIGGDQTIFERGTFTACDACKDDPSKPPFWQVRAKRIIHNQSEKMIYYEDAVLDLAGVPVLYVPYFSAPDHTVKRKSGFLTPEFIASQTLGAGLSVPYFVNLAPDRDLTLTPALFSRQGLLASANWRQRLENGDYSVSLAGINQSHPEAFVPDPNGPGDARLRGYLETVGHFTLNEHWDWGWDVALISDKWFLQNYKINSPSITQLGTIKRESTSTAYLHGEGDDSYFDGRGYYFRSLLAGDIQERQPLVLPVIDYDRRFRLNGSIGGEIALSGNFTNISRLEADFGSFNGGCSAPYTSANCFMRGIGGDYSRYTIEMSWRRSFIDPFGESWTPFVSLRGDLAFTTLFGNGDYNSAQSGFISSNNDALSRQMGTIGFTYRYPLIAPSVFGTQIVEPIVQIVSRPDENNIGKLPNEDSQSLVFDDTNLFSVDKFSGYDRVEGGTRANLGGQYTMNFRNGSHANLLFGQSFQIAGLDSFAVRGLSLEGTQSGLDTTRSDYVSRVQLIPNQDYSLTFRNRFDSSNFMPQRLEVEARARFGDFDTSLIYANYAPQPLAGIETRREGVGLGASYRLNNHWKISGSTLLSLSQYLTDPWVPHAYLAAYSADIGYHDECTDVALSYIGREPANDGTSDAGQTIFMRVTLRSLGSAEARQSTMDN